MIWTAAFRDPDQAGDHQRKGMFVKLVVASRRFLARWIQESTYLSPALR